MATFKIHVDDEQVGFQGREVKQKDVKSVGNPRCALSQITNNQIKGFNKPFADIGPVKDVLSKESKLVSSLKENIQSKGLKERGSSQNLEVSSPSKNLGLLKNHLENKNAGKISSPMSIDASQSTKSANKENVCQPSIFTENTPIRNSEKCQVAKSELPLESPMSIDSSPAVIHNKEYIQEDLEDLYACNPYKNDIYKYLRKIEENHRPKAYYMRRQPDVNNSMRTILVDWLVEVGEEYKLKNETLFMGVSFVDRFLSTMAVAKPKLQLLGTSALFIASKFEEIHPPEAGEFTFITDDSYTIKQVLRMERLILKVLSFHLSSPTSYTFLMHISACVKLPSKIIYLAMYICELSLLESDPYFDFYPSLIACGAIALARHCLEYSDVWPGCLALLTGYSFLQLGPIVNHLNETHRKSFTISQVAIRQKYSSSEYEGVSKIPFKRLVLRDSSSN